MQSHTAAAALGSAKAPLVAALPATLAGMATLFQPEALHSEPEGASGEGDVQMHGMQS